MSHILIGIGGTGGKILKAFRQRLWTEYDEAKRNKLPIGFIYVDTDSAMINPTDISYQTIHGNCCFTPSEFVDIKTNSNIDAIFSNPKGFTRLMGVLGNVSETQTATCPVGAAADQKRRAGRLLFGANIDAYLHKLGSEVASMQKKEVGGTINIHLFCGLAGGTGSGSIIDAIVQTRKWMFDHNINESTGFNLTVFCQIPENSPLPNWDTGRYKGNGYGALLELNNLFSSHYNQEWGTRVSTPPYDVTSNVELGRTYLTYNNPSPANIKAGAIPQELKIAGGLMLYSNTNNFGYTVTDPIQLAGLVADFVYNYIFCPGGPILDEFKRFYTFENLSQNRDEYDETADPEEGSPMPVRTRAIGSFGIKRVVVPETELQEHIAYTLGTSAMYQLKFDNWSNTVGYREESKNFDPLGYLSQPGRQDSWNMDSAHLMLKDFILPGDEKEGWKKGEFSTYWNPCIDLWAEAAKGADHQFDKLVELCRGGFENGFRGKGATTFFKDKASALETYANQISETVEKYIFNEWTTGRLSINEARQVVDRLTVYAGDEALNMQETTIPALDGKCKELQQTIQQVKSEYLNAGILKRPIIFGNRFERVTNYCKVLYAKKTEIEAIKLFAVPLAQALEKRFSDLGKRLIGFEQAIDDIIKFNKERMVALSDLYTVTNGADDRDGTEDMTLPVVKFYSRNRMADLERKMNVHESSMDKITETVRNSIVEALASDGRFMNVNKLNRNMLSRTLLGPVYGEIVTFHNEFCKEQSQKVLEVPIMERLKNKYGSNEQALQQFAKQIITASGVFTEINMNEIQLNNANTPTPEIGKNILIKRILVTLPKTKDPELLEFAERFEKALRDAIPGGAGASIHVSLEGQYTNEISVAIIENGYPMRAISSVPMLKAKFDSLIATLPANRILLVSEGYSDDYRTLFAIPPKSPDELRDDVMPYMILALGLGRILFDAETSGQYGATGGVDIFGNAEVTPWGFERFTEMAFNDRLIEERAKEIRRLYNDAMEEAFQDIDPSALKDIQAKLKELQTQVMGAIGKVIKEENPTPKTKYNQFVNWTKKAVETLLEYRPE